MVVSGDTAAYWGMLIVTMHSRVAWLCPAWQRGAFFGIRRSQHGTYMDKARFWGTVSGITLSQYRTYTSPPRLVLV